MRSIRVVPILLAACALSSSTAARAQSGDTPCLFASEATLAPLSAAGANGSLAANGFVPVTGLLPYETDFTVEVGVWVDDAFLATTPDAAALALRYFEHANCVFAAGRNLLTGAGINAFSLRLAGDRIRYYNATTPNLAGAMAPWAQRYHWDWAEDLGGMSGIPDVNLLFTTGGIVELDLSAPAGAANGIGQGHGIVAVDPTQFSNATKPNNLDWWGIDAAHELTHALGVEPHTTQLYDTICCADPAGYPAPGYFASEHVALSANSWGIIVANDFNTVDGYPDPWAVTPNPVTGEPWSYPQISHFLFDREGGDVFVAPSTGTSFLARVLRHDWFCVGNEVCLTGDFDGDGRDDLVAFTRGTTGDVFVSLSTGTGFAGTGVKWHDFFAINAETPLVGDWNGDGRDDIAAFTGGTAADVYVALSTGFSFAGSGLKWHNQFAPGDEVALAGDWNGDGRDDIAGLSRGTTGDVHVALSTGTSFGARTKWHEFFCINAGFPLAGDWNGDGRDDLATFTRGSTADVYVTLSTGAAFNGTGVKWHDFFAANAELPFAADVNGDGRDDLASFARGTLGRVYVARSSGAAFVGTNQIWTTNLCLGTDVCGLADVTGDGRADALGFHR